MPLIRSLLPMILAACLYGQVLHVPPSHTDRKSPGAFSLILESPPGKSPVALQWELRIPPAIAVAIPDITLGKTAEAGRKSLTCRQKPGKEGSVRYACILAGGQEPLGNGPVAVVHYRAQVEVGGAPIRVAIDNVLGVSADLKRIEIPDTAAIVEIRP